MNGLMLDLTQRGFIKQCTDAEALSQQLDAGPTTLYCGFDPTGPSLHVGHLVPLFALARFALAGHRPIALVGGGTARIGDPSGKTETRRMLDVPTIENNARSISTQINAIFQRVGVSVDYADNSEWLVDLRYIDFLRDIGRHFSVNRMLSFETYKMRMKTGLSFIEFNYQLLQSYDFLVLARDRGCRLQIGGDDQWGNIVAGVDLTRRLTGLSVHGLTFPLVTRSDGKKMGKTEKGSLFVDPQLCSPYDFYQYWRNVPDADVGVFLRLFTFLPIQEICELERLTDRDINSAKERLAYEFTTLIHGEAEAAAAQRTAKAAFGTAGPILAGSVDAAGDDAMPTTTIERARFEDGIGAVDLFAETGLAASKGEARRLIQQGGAAVNGVPVATIDTVVGTAAIIDGRVMLRAGKKRHFRVVVRDADVR